MKEYYLGFERILPGVERILPGVERIHPGGLKEYYLGDKKNTTWGIERILPVEGWKEYNQGVERILPGV